MVTVTGPPSVAVALAVRVNTCVPVNPVANDAVTPVGKPDAASETLPLNPPASVMVMVSTLLLPCATDNVGAEAESVKLGGGGVTAVPLSVAVVSVPIFAVPV